MSNWTIDIMLKHQQSMFYTNRFVLNIVNMQKSWKYRKICSHILPIYIQRTIANILCMYVCIPLSFHTRTHILMNFWEKKFNYYDMMLLTSNF